MYPFLLPEYLGYTMPLYDLMIVIGILFMVIYITKRFEKQDGFTRKQTNKLLLLTGISLLVALFSSYVFDGIFHSIKEGEWVFGSITFIGGLIGGIVSFLILLKFFYKDENKDVKKIMNTIIPGVVLAHAFGRIGCFFAGCCFGIPTDSMLGVVFPHGNAPELYGDVAVYPTQLFESFFLFMLFIALNKIEQLKNIEVEAYLVGYGLFRIIIEFIRGDERGSLFPFITTQYNVFPSPSQYLSLMMVIFGIYFIIRNVKSKNMNLTLHK